MSASWPGASRPFRFFRLANAAVFCDIHWERSCIDLPLLLASVHTADKPNCNEEIPPQALFRSLSDRNLSSGTQEEWSETTKSIVPSCTADQSFSRFSRSLIGGAHLNLGSPSAISS